MMTMMMMPAVLLLLLGAGCDLAAAMENGLVRTPPLGWMSWMCTSPVNRHSCSNAFRSQVSSARPWTDRLQRNGQSRYYTTDVSEEIIKGVADELVAGGYKEAGYTYVCIDDGWSTHRDPVTKQLVADPAKFPSGMKAVAEYVHSKGLLFGMYADVGPSTCGGYSGLGMDKNLSSKQYIQDIATFAEWKVDALKVDGCNESPEIMNVTYPALSDAINASGHPMWLSCSWPCYVGGCFGGPQKIDDDVYTVVQQKCNTARDMNDIYDNIDSLYSIIGAYTTPKGIASHNRVNGPGFFSDADMLTAGAGGLSTVEEEMQMGETETAFP